MKKFLLTLVAVVMTALEMNAETTYYINSHDIDLQPTESVALNNDIIVLCTDGHADTNWWDGRLIIQGRHGKNIKSVTVHANRIFNFETEMGMGWHGAQHADWEGPCSAVAFTAKAFNLSYIEITVE